MVNIGYHTARFQGQITSNIYRKLVDKISGLPIKQSRRVNTNVYAFSCERDLPVQVASIRSFIRHVGIPDKFIVISDGSYTVHSRKILCQINSCVEVIDWKDLANQNIPGYIFDYALNHPHRPTMAMWRRLAVFMSLSIDKPTICTDADILFFPGATDLIDLCEREDKYAWYLPDCKPSLDERILLDENDKLNPVNAGFFILKTQLDWLKPLERVAKFVDSPIFYTDQTIVHLAMHNAHAKALAEDKYIINVDDQFIYPDRYAAKHIALRHYVNDVRHKFWFNVGL
ncbi:hypothetical protein H6G74_07295 [Nostoc spongiaeforme FACHB-130]|uniref:Nucleotide-diphospho-sugar transferase domain-containing protein n=1 Tax=Nostoc spongiaeforme FACHB-130 TaxID=1357510 RepID=A0ABR8FRS8_9NOSO|nr:hypothetical protein [Nostoc spongiaeforme]MBD2594135.1 hypothetical protein [Nostoc spongiaeforme FACHB-130]